MPLDIDILEIEKPLEEGEEFRNCVMEGQAATIVVTRDRVVVQVGGAMPYETALDSPEEVVKDYFHLFRSRAERARREGYPYWLI